MQDNQIMVEISKGFNAQHFKPIQFLITREQWHYLIQILFSSPPIETANEVLDLVVQDTLRQVAIKFQKRILELEDKDNELELTAAEAYAFLLSLAGIMEDLPVQEKILYVSEIVEKIYKAVSS